MTTTTLTKNTLLNSIKGADGSSLTIAQDTMKEALDKSDIIKLAERKGRDGGNNTYYQVGNPQDNTILMHVKNNQYVVINRYVYCHKTNNYVDVLPVLEQFSFYSDRTNSNRCHVVASTPVNLKQKGFSGLLYMTRVLTSLELYGELRNLDSTYDVHHKADCWDNRQNMIMYVERSRHTHRKSHMTGRYIGSHTAFLSMCAGLIKSYERFSSVTAIA